LILDGDGRSLPDISEIGVPDLMNNDEVSIFSSGLLLSLSSKANIEFYPS
jgi:hypothetical protein